MNQTTVLKIATCLKMPTHRPCQRKTSPLSIRSSDVSVVRGDKTEQDEKKNTQETHLNLPILLR